MKASSAKRAHARQFAAFGLRHKSAMKISSVRWRNPPRLCCSRGVPSMCDYSLHQVASRPAKVGDKLVTTRFGRSITRGFAAVGEPDVAVCLLPGTELAFQEVVRYEPRLGLF